MTFESKYVDGMNLSTHHTQNIKSKQQEKEEE